MMNDGGSLFSSSISSSLSTHWQDIFRVLKQDTFINMCEPMSEDHQVKKQIFFTFL